MCALPHFNRIHEHERTTRRLSDRLKEVEEQMKTLTLTHQELTDEHHTLQLTCSSTEKRLKETFQENDRLVSAYSACQKKLPINGPFNGRSVLRNGF